MEKGVDELAENVEKGVERLADTVERVADGVAEVYAASAAAAEEALDSLPAEIGSGVRQVLGPAHAPTLALLLW